ncbi:MAG: LLM class flavin-dependent oxidoreductase [Immundisolibacterales bacterium]|nr:LLM class flavin-dependent oxidoreductase [Immundisolibacterales bacterium]
MDFGVCAITKIDDVGLAVEAENLGYSDLWVPDSQMIWSDCYAFMALAARATRTIRLGTGVSVAGTRTAPVTAHSIATINRLAPGRTFLGIGTGNTAQRLMGQPPIRYAEFEEYVRVLRGLLDGAEVEYAGPGGERRPIRFDMLDLGFMQIEPRIPIHVSGFYHRTQRLAGRYGDGLVVSIPPHRDFVTRARAHAARGAAEAGRELPAGFRLSSLTTAVVLEPGETLESDRVIRDCGPFVVSSIHYIYEKIRENGGEPPPHMRGFWKEYCRLVEETPERSRHFRVHAGHCTWLHPDEAEFVTPDLIRTTCLAGTPDELVESIRHLDEAGLDHVMLLPSLETQRQTIEAFSRKVMARL